MDRYDETDELWLLFEQDGLRSLDEAEQHLLALETAPESARDLNGLYRALHSLKGNARVMGLSELEALTHQTEDLVGLCRDGVCALAGDVFDTVLEAADLLREVVPEVVSSRGDLEPARVMALVDRLTELVAVFDVAGARGAAADADGAVFDDGAADFDFDFDFGLDLPAEAGAEAEPEGSERSLGTSDPVADAPVSDGEAPADAPVSDGAAPAEAPVSDGEAPADAPVSDGAAPAEAPISDGAAPADALVSDGAAPADAPVSDGAAPADPEPPVSDGPMPYESVQDDRATDEAVTDAEVRGDPVPTDPDEAAAPTSGRTAAETDRGSETLGARPEGRSVPPRREAEIPEPDGDESGEGSASSPPSAPGPRGRRVDPPRRDAVIQVRASKIQELLSIASDLGLSTDALLAHPGLRALSETSEDVTEQAHRLRRLMRDLRFAAAGLALVPMSELFAKVRRMGRDLARQTGKDFEVVLEGEETEIDKSLVDALSDPVLHIIRNAIDHGIEPPEDRIRAGKSPKGRISVTAAYSGNEVLLVFADDGRGLDTERIRKKAEARGLLVPGSQIDEVALHRLVFHPGFSTRDAVSELSGRGVGMDVVNESIKALRGRIDLRSTPGRGTALSIFLPLTLAFADALVVDIGAYLYAIPLESVGRIFLPEVGDWVKSSADGVEYVRLAERTVPVHWLDGAARRPPGDDRRQPIVTVRFSGGEIALPVDVLRGTEQITMRPLDRYSRSHPAASSCGILSNGDIATTLDCERLVASRTEMEASGPAQTGVESRAVVPNVR